MISHKISLFKAISWRFLGTLTTAFIVLIITRKWQLSLFVSIVEVVSKVLAYYIHERIWERVLTRLQ